MDPHNMATWAYSHACDKCQAGETCQLEACINAQEVADFLKRHYRFEGVDSSGKQVRGWFVPDQV
jgi:hypothetical protein